jgi:uncharacterized repeat protein (TIGR01451 family)
VDVISAQAGIGAVTANVTRPDLRPLPGVTLQLAGAVTLQGVTDDNGAAAFLGLPPAGTITITPSRSGFRFEPAQFTIPDLANPPAASFRAFPTATDLALSIANDDTTPLVGGLVNSVITLRNLGTEAGTDVTVGVGSLPGMELEDAQATQGGLDFHAGGTLWHLSQLNPCASAEVHARYRATLPDAAVLTVAVIQEMDQPDTNPLNNSALLTTQTRAAQARLSLAMAINPATAKAGGTLPVGLTVRNDGPNDATEIAIRAYVPPGASLVLTNQSILNSGGLIPRLAAGAQLELNGQMFVRFAGTFTLVANVTYFEQQLPSDAAWPEARADFTVQPAYSHLTLFAFTDPPNPRVGDTVNVTYVARNDGPDAITGLKLFTREDARLGTPLSLAPDHPPPPVAGPFAFGDYLPVGAYTYSGFTYSVQAAGDLTNYFTVEYQDQSITNAADYPEMYVPIKTLPADIGLSLDANPKVITAAPGDPVTIEFPVHNDGPQPAHALIVDFDIYGLASTDLDEIIHADRVVRPTIPGYIDVVDPGETVTVRKHFVASISGFYTNTVEIKTSFERPDLLMPIAAETVLLHVLPAPNLPDLAIAVNVDTPQVNVGEYALFIVTVTNRTAQPALNVSVSETDPAESGFAFETVRSYGPNGDDRFSTASQRLIPRIEPGASYSMSRTMRVRKPVTIPYLAKIDGVNGLQESDLPRWRATNEVTGVQVTGDMAAQVVPDRTNVKNGDLVNFAIISSNLSSHVASHVGIYTGESAGFQVLDSGLGDYGYFWDTSRPLDLQSGAKLFSEWLEIPPEEAIYSWLSTYTVGAGQLTVGAQVGYLDQIDAQTNNDLALVQINSAAASATVSLRQSTLPNASVGDLVVFLTEIRNQGPDRVTGLTLLESSSTNLELNLSASVNGVSGNFVTSVLDSLVRLPALEPGQNFIWQRTYVARAAGDAWRHVSVASFDQTSLAPLPENQAAVTVQPAQADLELQLLNAPSVAQVGIPTLVVVRVRNLGPAVATGVQIAVTVPTDVLTLGTFQLGPRAGYDLSNPNGFLTQLRQGESATASFYVTPTRVGATTGLVQVQQSDQIDPQPANNTVSFTLDVGPEPPIPPILRVSKVRTDFFNGAPIAEVEIDQAALNRLAPLGIFSLEASSNLRDWEFLRDVGFLPLAPVTFTDHVAPGVTSRAYRLRR